MKFGRWKTASLIILLIALVFTFINCAGPKKTHGNTFFTAGSWDIPPAFHGNPWAPGGYNSASFFVYEPLFAYNALTSQYIPRLGKSFHESEDYKTLTIKIHENIYWHDGHKFTANDVKTTFHIGYLKGFGVWYNLDDIECPDDYTIIFRFRRASPLNTIQALTEIITSPYHIFGEWADLVPEIRRVGKNYKKLSREERLELHKNEAKIREVLYKFHPSLPIGTGPFKIDRVSSSDITMMKFQQHYEVENIHVDKVHLIRWANNQVIWAHLLSGDMDIGYPATPYDVSLEVLKRNPGMKIITPSNLSDFGLIFNCKKPPVSDYNFRKAIAHIIDRDVVRQVAYTYGETISDYSLGLPMSIRDHWFDEDFFKELTVYDHNPEKARQILQQAGYKKDKSGWKKPDGSSIYLEIIAPSGLTDLVLLAEAASTQLTKFGIQTNVRTIPMDIFFNTIQDDNYDMAVETCSQLLKYGHPSTSYNAFYGDGGLIREASKFPPRQNYRGQIVDIKALTKELNFVMDEKRSREIVEILAWITNENLPYLACYEKKFTIFILDGKRMTGFPAPDDEIWGLAPAGMESLYSLLLVKGKLKPVNNNP
jgi:peptide/nickel transport system substrate-binding protein